MFRCCAIHERFGKCIAFNFRFLNGVQRCGSSEFHFTHVPLSLSLITQIPVEELLEYNPFKVSELEVKYPHIRWMDYFEALMPTDVKITLDDEVNVPTPEYIRYLAGILQKTSKRTIANYFVWR